ncbi:MAG: glycoside hydrolase family 16 protein [Acidobacteriota bacterium]|nr:glycoside hydrolase family 16 protein [Acidobacteriota bacterium]
MTALSFSDRPSIPRPLRSLVALLFVFAAVGSAQSQTVLWSEEFDSPSTLDCSVWSFDIGDGCAEGICGWGNAEFQDYTRDPANVRVENGQLIITAQREQIGGGPSYAFTSARLKTENRMTFQYGTVEARIQLPDLADGLWPAFWTLGNNISTVGWPDCGEIDIFEMGNAGAIAEGVVNRRVGSTAHWESGDGYAGYGLSYTAPSDLNDTFHIYRMEWTPSAISTYIDGIWIWTIGISNPSSFDGEEFHAPHFLLLNMAVGGNYTGIVDDEADISAPFPAEYRVDWIRIYDNGHTILGGTGPRGPLSLDRAGNDVELQFATDVGISYDIVYKTNLSDSTWTVLQTVVGDGSVMSVFDPIGAPGAYYRVVSAD